MKRSYIVAFLIIMFSLVSVSSLTALAEEGKAAAAKKPAEKKVDKKKADPFVVPKDATPDELEKYLKRLVFLRCKAKGYKERMEFYKKKARPTLEAANQILASSESTEKQIQNAASKKLWGLSILSRDGDPEIIEAINQFPKQLTELGLTKLVERAEIMQCHTEFEQALAGAPGAMTVDEVINKIKKDTAGKTDSKSITLVRMVISGVKSKISREKALSLCDDFVKHYTEVEGKDAKRIVRQLKGVARRMDLVGNTMEINGTLLDGKTLDWSKYKGKVVLVQFWATWCAPCRAEIPNIKKYYELYHDKGFDVIGISLDSDREKLEKYIEDKEMPWAMIFEEGKENAVWNTPMALDYAVSGIPTLILIDQEGKVVTTRARGTKLSEELTKLLGPLEESKEKSSEEDSKD